MASVNIKAEPREISTKGAINKLRRDGFVPGVIYSKELEPQLITVSEIALKPVVYTTEMNLIELKIGESEPVTCVLQDIQFDPLTDHIIHIDFQAITVGQKIQVQVPLNVIGQAIGVKKGGRLNQNLHKLDVECLPKDIPSHVEIDVTSLEIGQSILIRDLELENIKILNPEDASIVAVTTSRAVEEDEVETDEMETEEAPSEPELVGKSSESEE